MKRINIIGSGLAGLSAAYSLAKKNIPTRLISVQPSERAQSNLAEGGINASLNVMGEDDSWDEHFSDTIRGGCFIADEAMVRGLVENAPDIVCELEKLGVPFHRENGHIIQRNFGGQKKKRTAYAKSSTGKVLMAAMTDAVRKYESTGLIKRYPHHRFERIFINENTCDGVQVQDVYSKESLVFAGSVIMATGGMNGMLEGNTTGTTANTGTAAARLFSQGVTLSNLEFIQYHPTTISIVGKRLLISEAARGEGGRLFYLKDDKPVYFMEEKYGKRGNLMPRDVISREMAGLKERVYLDLRGLSDEVWQDKLSDLRDEVASYTGIDVAKEPIEVSPGVHYFMGGIAVDKGHRTSVKALYAAGECAAAYHGANRLGGNSLLGAIYGGKVAAASVAEDNENGNWDSDGMISPVHISYMTEDELDKDKRMQEILFSGMSVIRSESTIKQALDELKVLRESSDELKCRIILAEAILKSALLRKESRGAHTRLDYPESSDEYKKCSLVRFKDERIELCFGVDMI